MERLLYLHHAYIVLRGSVCFCRHRRGRRGGHELMVTPWKEVYAKEELLGRGGLT
jgi:hypothetical protein